MSGNGRMAVRLAALMLVAAVLAGCGKKPGRLDAPSGDASQFPRTYPKPQTPPTPQPATQPQKPRSPQPDDSEMQPQLPMPFRTPPQ